jgi:hypothetical protein
MPQAVSFRALGAKTCRLQKVAPAFDGFMIKRSVPLLGAMVSGYDARRDLTLLR